MFNLNRRARRLREVKYKMNNSTFENKPFKFTSIFSMFIGTVLEWYDFSIFMFFVPVFSELFFPNANKIASYLSMYAVFAISFFVRPLGAAIFGYFGDHLGRKKVLVFSMNLISISTLAMGLLPTYQTIGVLAPVLLVFFRLLQGFCVGGETTGAASFIIESFPERYRGVLGSFMWSAVGVGMLLGSFITTLIIKSMTHDTLIEIGWRLPFLFGVITGVVGYYFRKKIPETALFSSIQNKGQITKLSTVAVIKENRKSLLIIMGLYALSSMITYLVFVFMPVYASSVLNIPLGTAGTVTTIAIGCVTFCVPLAGLLSDRIGRKPCLYIGSIGFFLLSYPLYLFMSNDKSMFSFIFSEIIFVLIATVYQGTLTAAVQEMPRTTVRYTVTSLGYNVSYAVFGGTAPFVVTYLSNLFGSKSIPGLYLSMAGIVAIIAIFNMKETYKKVLS